MLNCNVWGVTDFGEGSVRVRCTHTDEHEEHACFVKFTAEPVLEPPPGENVMDSEQPNLTVVKDD